jgi:CheY-like chemotaxis protein
MRVEVHCSSCDTEYVLDEAFAGTTLPCPACGAEDGLRVPEARPAAPAPVPSAALVPAQAPAAVAATAEDAETGEVVCPRCKLHFVPRRTKAEADENVRKTVLVVEDMDYFREAAAEALSLRFEVKEASSLDEARAVLRSGGVDLMVLDLTLGGGESGMDLLRALPSKPCPILIYTDQDESEMYSDSWEELQQLGADDILMKGMNVGELLTRKACGLLGLPWDEDEVGS